MSVINNLKVLIDAGKISVDEVTSRLMEKVDKCGKQIDGMTQCWISSGTPSSGGYGQIRVSGVSLQTHRLSWWLHNGMPEMARNEYIGHKCDNPTCCNPDHLENITAAKNIKDAYERGLRISHTPKDEVRHTACTECQKGTHDKCDYVGIEDCTRCKRLGLVCIREERKPQKNDFAKGKHAGERNIKCKLSDAKYLELLEKIETTKFVYGTVKKLAEEYGVTPSYVTSIKTGRAERNLTPAGGAGVESKPTEE